MDQGIINLHSEYTKDQIDLIKNQIAKECTDQELKYFLEVCKQTKLNPFLNQIYAVKRKVKDKKNNTEKMVMTIGYSIEGYRAIAHRTGRCLSISDTKFTYDKEGPITATITVKKIVNGMVGEFTATAHWVEYYGNGNNYMANDKLHIMLGKSSEILALKKAFPQEICGDIDEDTIQDYSNDEEKEVPVIGEDELSEEPNPEKSENEKLIVLIRDNINSIWHKLNVTERENLMDKIICSKNAKELNSKSTLELKEIYSNFCKYIDTLKS